MLTGNNYSIKSVAGDGNDMRIGERKDIPSIIDAKLLPNPNE